MSPNLNLILMSHNLLSDLGALVHYQTKEEIFHEVKNYFFKIEISNFLSAIAVIPLSVNKIASSGGFGPQNRSFPLYRSPLNTSFTVYALAFLVMA